MITIFLTNKNLQKNIVDVTWSFNDIMFLFENITFPFDQGSHYMAM
jgi:virulence-associated protein VapD